MIKDDFTQVLLEQIGSDVNMHNVYLQHGLSGYCAFYFWLSQKAKDENYETLAEKMLLRVTNSIKQLPTVDIENGITGIGLFVMWLNKKGFLTGKGQSFFETIEAYLYKTTNLGIDTNSEVIELHNLLDVLVFLTERLELETIEEPYKQFLKLWSIKIIAYIHQRVNTILADEPLLADAHYDLVTFLYVLFKLHKLGVYTYYLERIINEIRMGIITRIPYLQQNRAYLYYTLCLVSKEFSLGNEWETYMQWLKRSFSINAIIVSEIKDNQLFGQLGLIRLYFALKYYIKNGIEIEIPYDLILKKIKSSSYYKNKTKVAEVPKGLDGILGLYLLYINIVEYGTKD